ncbi:hybrid sensor histidine kinase/response regulator [Anaerobiospirillum succiniciproducens]|uniref:hybrid sensor histidine kinase/response regulator n=1 Tax=Anaerobiospirillum succiniciproducens TaxID=13335 RepID=UPI0005C75050|nr:hybrid sensor histidine kinase/response regulator [Anaerobiospirillum succiniciproducens]
MFNFQSRSEAYSLFRSRTRKAKKIFLSYGTILFFVFSIFLVASLYMMRENIIASSNSAGNETAQRLDVALKYEFVKEKQFIEFIAHYADVFLKTHRSDADGGKRAFELWLKKTKDELQERQRDFIIDIYSSINGQIVAPTYWDGDPFLIPEARTWYQEAMKAEIGHATVLDPYVDIFTNTVITTIAARIGNTKDVIAIDLYLEKSAQAHSFANMVPENFSFYLVDSAGTVILYYDDDASDYFAVQDFVYSFFDSHVKNHAEENHEPIIDPTGAKRNVFTSFNPITGWYTITTSLYSDVLFSYHTISNLFLLLVVVFIIIEVWMVWREYHLSSQIETSNEALKVLGNSYQIILRVNFKMGTFTTLKAPDQMRLRLVTRNSYDDLLSALSDMVLPESWNNFYKTFSINHLRNLASLSIRDFGHDYQLKLDNDDRYKWFNARILFDESLDLDESILCFKLIDEEKITEIEEHKLLADALENAKQNEESKNVFFANMSHDMRTPLNGIIGLCQIGINHMNMNDTDSLPDIFRKMTTASKQLLALVDDILEVARPQMENRQNLEPFDIIKAVEENIDVFKVNAAQQGKVVNLSFDIKHNVVIGDAAKLRQILNNLVSNSLKYSNKGCVVNVSIREVLHLHKPSFMIEVSDTGIGMERKFLSKLFDAYSREHRLNSVQGTGLGMSIVKNVVTIMGGDIKVKSAVDVGTTFTINIPFRLADDDTANKIRQIASSGAADFSNGVNAALEQAALLPSVNKSDNAEKEQHSEISTNEQATAEANSADNTARNSTDVAANFKLEGLHILVVEDNELNMEIACDILQMKGVKVSCAWDGAEAVKVFKEADEYTFDAILMDMRMPNMNGCEASAAIRALGRADSLTVPIIACTANAFTEDITATQNAGMNAHVSKPLDFTVLERVLQKLVATRRDLDVMQALRAPSGSTADTADDTSHSQDSSTSSAAAASEHDDAQESVEVTSAPESVATADHDLDTELANSHTADKTSVAAAEDVSKSVSAADADYKSSAMANAAGNAADNAAADTADVVAAATATSDSDAHEDTSDKTANINETVTSHEHKLTDSSAADSAANQDVDNKSAAKSDELDTSAAKAQSAAVANVDTNSAAPNEASLEQAKGAANEQDSECSIVKTLSEPQEAHASEQKSQATSGDTVVVNEAIKKLADLDSINRSATVNAKKDAKSMTHDAASNGEILNKDQALVGAKTNEPILDATHRIHDLDDTVKKSVSNAKYYEIEIKASNEDATPSLIPVDKLSSSFKINKPEINKPETNSDKSNQLSSDHDSAQHNTFINLLKFKKASAKPQPQPQEVDKKDISQAVNYSQDEHMVPERKAPPPKIAHEKSSKTTVSLRSQLTRNDDNDDFS